jgi:hypothetical protein
MQVASGNAAALPPFGLLLAKAFDRAVTVTLVQWPWFIGCVVAYTAVERMPYPWQEIIHLPISVVWWTAVWVGALKLTQTGFRPSRGFLLRLIGLYFILSAIGLIASLVGGVGLLLLLFPALYFGTRLWVAPAVIALEDKGVGQAIVRSWELTGRVFWKTFAFAGFIFLVELILFAGRELAILGSTYLLVSPWYHVALDTMLRAGGNGLYQFIDAAEIVCILYWFPALAALPDNRALKRKAEAGAA